MNIKTYYPKFLVDFVLEIQLKMLGKLILLNIPNFSNYKDKKIIIYSNHFYIYDVHILNRLRKTIFKDRKMIIWMEEYDKYPFFSKFALTLPFKEKHIRTASIIKTIRLLNEFPNKFYFFIFPEGKLHDENDGILDFNVKIYNFLKRIEPYYALPMVIKIKNRKIIVNFGNFELNTLSKEKLVSLLNSTFIS
ncbi:MAG: hypothetical protein RQ990_04780 [Candidatus Hydrothermia bacterium]|jgi:hypothetical protein|nr:hypothetical protein [Candidatus Hydrothermia bacterium]